MERITIYVDHLDDSTDFKWVQAWLARWQGEVKVAKHSTGGWEHIWDVEASSEAVAEVPKDWLCVSEWSATNK